MKNYKKNKEILEKSFNYSSELEHDACGVGLIASTNGKKSRKIVDYGIEALKAVWHRGAVDADGKSGDGAGIQIEIALIFQRKILSTGHTLDENKRFVWNGFPSKNRLFRARKCREIIESNLTKNYYIYG